MNEHLIPQLSVQSTKWARIVLWEQWIVVLGNYFSTNRSSVLTFQSAFNWGKEDIKQDLNHEIFGTHNVVLTNQPWDESWPTCHHQKLCSLHRCTWGSLVWTNHPSPVHSNIPCQQTDRQADRQTDRQMVHTDRRCTQTDSVMLWYAYLQCLDSSHDHLCIRRMLCRRSGKVQDTISMAY